MNIFVKERKTHYHFKKHLKTILRYCLVDKWWDIHKMSFSTQQSVLGKRGSTIYALTKMYLFFKSTAKEVYNYQIYFLWVWGDENNDTHLSLKSSG